MLAYREYEASITVDLTKEVAKGKFEARFAVPLAKVFLCEEARLAPFRLLVELLDLNCFSCSSRTAGCDLVMDHELMRSTVSGPASEEQSAFLPYGQTSGPAPYKRLYTHIVSQMPKDELQREFRYGPYSNANEVMATLDSHFDPKTNRYSPPASSNGTEHLMYLLFRTNPDASLSAADIMRPKREHFAHVLQVMDNHYFKRPRTRMVYAHQMGGLLRSDERCKVRMSFTVRIAWLRARGATTAAHQK